MTVNQRKKDRVISAVLTQLEMLQELAESVEETELANDLSAIFAKSLARYCDHKRTQLASQLAKPLDAALASGYG